MTARITSLRKQAADEGITETGKYLEWLEQRLAAATEGEEKSLRLKDGIRAIQAEAVPMGSDYGNGTIAAICERLLAGKKWNAT